MYFNNLKLFIIFNMKKYSFKYKCLRNYLFSIKFKKIHLYLKDLPGLIGKIWIKRAQTKN